ncbi:MAG: sigma-70 family RNA polymerase sigma factor [Holosporales bacterium]|jgi:RNA polymerase sigma-32 factor|nr:sigma-70 family RNA polymerase sigma factor [Holosporales bacterium]
MEPRGRKEASSMFHSKQEEEQVFRKLQSDKSEATRHTIILSYSQLIRNWAIKYGRFYSVDVDELISEGTLGLMKALELFDVDKGFRFATYASFWIKAFLRQYVIISKSIVRRSKRNVQMLSRYGEECSLSWNAFNSSFQTDVSIDKSAEDGGEGEGGSFLEVYPDERADFEGKALEKDQLKKRVAIFKKVSQKLKDKEVDVIKRRHLKVPSETLENIARDLKITMEGVRQIEKRAIAKMQNEVKKAHVIKLSKG